MSGSWELDDAVGVAALKLADVFWIGLYGRGLGLDNGRGGTRVIIRAGGGLDKALWPFAIEGWWRDRGMK